MISLKLLGVLFLVLTAATVVGMIIQNALYWTVYNYATLIISVLGGVVLLKQK